MYIFAMEKQRKQRRKKDLTRSECVSVKCYPQHFEELKGKLIEHREKLEKRDKL